MNEEKHCMIDLETLGNSHDAAIIQIGACIFTKEEISTNFETNIDFDSAIQYGTVTGNTIQWWMQQNDEAIKAVSKEECNLSLPQALREFISFVQVHEPVYYWAHATFDFPIIQIIQNAFRSVGMPTPIGYKQCKDLRTAEYLLPDIEWPERQGTYHSGRDDAIYQAQCLQLMWKKGKEKCSEKK